MDIKEYILNIYNETFAVYAESEKQAINTFLKLCDKYSDTENINFKNYWLNLKDFIKREGYKIIENADFHGVRKL